jgi:hypothetical protein
MSANDVCKITVVALPTALEALISALEVSRFHEVSKLALEVSMLALGVST